MFSGLALECGMLCSSCDDVICAQEEERIVRHERRILQEKLKQPDIPTVQKRVNAWTQSIH